jgi:hypothetical protein
MVGRKVGNWSEVGLANLKGGGGLGIGIIGWPMSCVGKGCVEERVT